MRRTFLLSIAALAGAVVGSPCAASSTAFFDPTVDPATYAVTIFKTDPTVVIAVAATASGHPGSALDIHYTNAGGIVNMESYLGFVRPVFAYTPSTQGAIGSIDFANDRYVEVGATFGPLIAIFSRSLVLQNGRFYFAPFADPDTKGAWYTSASPPLTSADYAQFDFTTGLSDPTSHPDFSATGALVAFGFISRFNLVTAGAYALDADFRFDNIAIRINGVPEPDVVALLGIGVAVATGVGLRRRPRAG